MDVNPTNDAVAEQRQKNACRWFHCVLEADEAFLLDCGIEVDEIDFEWLKQLASKLAGIE